MTTPQGPQDNDPKTWARPGNQGPPPTQPAARPAPPPPGREGSTQRIPRPSSPMDQPTQHIPRAIPGEEVTQKIPTAGVPPQPPIDSAPPPGVAEKPPAKRSIWRDPVSIVLIVVIAFALVAAGLAGAEWYARDRAATIVGEAIKCVAKDDASNVSFAIVPPFLWQHMTGDYKDIRITTDGANIRDAKGMKADISIADVRLDGGKFGAGTIGPLDATITWPASGIKETAQQVALVGTMVTDVKTSSADGTITLSGPFGNVVAKPEVTDHDLKVNLVSINGGGLPFPPDLVQPFLTGITDSIAENYPLNVKPDSVQVTDDGVVGHFSSPGADIPQNNQDPCFSNL